MGPNPQLEIITNTVVLTVPVNGDESYICSCMEVKKMIDVMRTNPWLNSYIQEWTGWSVNGAIVRF